MSFRLHIAGPEDDAEIRALLARNPVPGRVVVSYEREPNYFSGCRTMGPFSQVVVARDEATGELAAVACRTIRRRYVDGEPREVGYLGQLRVDDRYRGRWLVSQGFRFMKGLDADGRTESYITTITREGVEARRLLVELKRPHFPSFAPLDDIATLALVTRGRRRPKPRQAAVSEVEANAGELAAFYAANAPRRQYYPTWEPSELGDARVIAVRRDDALAGALAVWDQSSYKQAVVRGYAPALGRILPLYNAAMRLRGRPRIPPVGAEVRFAFASFVAVENDERTVFARLLDGALDAAASRGADYLMVGLSTRDPLLPVARRIPHVGYASTLYRVAWNGKGGTHGRCDDRIPYVEIATL